MAIKDGTVSADLFESDIDEYRKIDNENGKIQQGYSYYDFDAGIDLLEWESYNPDDHAFVENVTMYEFWDVLFGRCEKTESGVENLVPIVMLDAEDFSGTHKEISDRLYVNASHVDKLKLIYDQAVRNDETVVLFRFALTDYYSGQVDVFCNDFWNGRYDGLAYRAWQSVFLDFDVIQLSFKKEGKITVIPAVSNPIDIVPDITPPVNWVEDVTNWIWVALGIIAVLVFIMALYKILIKQRRI